MILSRRPTRALRPFVSLLWATDGAAPGAAKAERERMLPTGAMHLAIRLGNSPVRFFKHPSDLEGHIVGTAVLGGVRTGPFCKEIADRTPSVGAMLQPGAVDLLSRAPAGDLRDRHTSLDDLWPASPLAELRERLETTPSLTQRLAIFEHMLASQLPAVRGVDPLVAHALRHLDAGMSVGQLVAETGFSHRHLVRVFTQAVGTTPKAYVRLRRFNRAIRHLHATRVVALADVAALLGYADQAHMGREFQDFAGMTPGQYLRAASRSPHHVPLGG